MLSSTTGPKALILTGVQPPLGEEGIVVDDLYLDVPRINRIVAGINKLAGWEDDIFPLKIGWCDGLLPFLKEFIKKVADSCSKVDVFYVGDLKPHTCPLNSIFFNLSGDANSDDIRDLFINACTKGEQEIEMINLANVRHLKMRISPIQGVTALHIEMKTIQDYITAIEMWDAQGKGPYVMEFEEYASLH